MHWGYAIDAMKMVEHALMRHLRQIKVLAEANNVPHWGDMERWTESLKETPSETGNKRSWAVEGDKFGGPKGR